LTIPLYFFKQYLKSNLNLVRFVSFVKKPFTGEPAGFPVPVMPPLARPPVGHRLHIGRFHVGRLYTSRFNYNIRRAFCVYQCKMKRLFRVRGNLKQGPVLWFVNRSAETGCYALDEAFSREEAERLQRLLQKRNVECRIQEITANTGAERSASWNLIGRLVQLEDGDQLPFSVVGCLEF
jgi:hypothetical protein